jgi:hypothetical protein
MLYVVDKTKMKMGVRVITRDYEGNVLVSMYFRKTSTFILNHYFNTFFYVWTQTPF